MPGLGVMARGPHKALNALYAAIMTRNVGWILDADIRGYFDAIDHGWLMTFIEHRIADKRVLRHIKKWLNTGVLEDGVKTLADEGVPQGGSISPLLANRRRSTSWDLPTYAGKPGMGSLSYCGTRCASD